MPEKENLYFIAVIPPDDISADIDRFKHDFATRFSSKAALKVMPHITVKSPFKLAASGHDEVLSWFRQLNITVAPFEITLENFGSFVNKNKPVIFVQPLASEPLAALQKEMIASFRKAYPSIPVMWPEWHFNPHITIAYRDLELDKFNQAWNEYQLKQYSATFEVEDIFLLQHNGRQWKIIASRKLVE
ncbi:2'-5' RNA ligase family protein [Foetidibacter luteolus]|uniref:2'-5' RNA ligase family protein n=1 Tax=Foetidibacter luteolus TaxID=2608880 RepID=UPI00129AC491|nr:2'-5' RNA ligase family protein [Foetidibacter luteolus]